MRAFLNLSVRLKLAVSSALALLLLAGLAAFITQDTQRIIDRQRAAAGVEEAADRIEEGLDLLRDLAVLERDLLLAVAGAQQGPAWAAIAGAFQQGTQIITQASGAFNDPGVALASQALLTAAETYRASLQQVAEQRARLIQAHDGQLLPAAAAYDTVFEAVAASISFDLSGDAEDAARDRLMTVHAAVNDIRLGVQGLLATGADNQARRVRTGVAQARVHGRGLATIEAPDRLKEDLGRLVAQAEALSTAATTVLAAIANVETIRRDRVGPARTGMQTRYTALNAEVARISAAARTEVSETAAAMRTVCPQKAVTAASTTPWTVGRPSWAWKPA
jgi:hypothetical protein